MAFRTLAQITVNPDGTITGNVLPGELPGVGLVTNGVYELGFDSFSVKLALQYVGKPEGVSDADQS